MRVALFTDTYFPQVNGIATCVKILADHLKSRGHEVIIFAPKIKASKTDKSENVIRINSVKVFPHLDELRLPIVLQDSLKEINDFKFDIVHAHGNALFSLLGYFSAKRRGVPFVLTFHMFMEDYTHYLYAGKKLGDPIVKRIYRFYANLCDAIVAPSVKMQKTLVANGVKKEITVIPNFIEISKFSQKDDGFIQEYLGLDRDAQVLLFVGRVSKEKNVRFLIKTFFEINKSDPSVHLAIVGNGPLKKSLEILVAKVKKEKNVHFLGIVDRDLMPRIYASSTIFVFPSTSEVHPMVALEAGASGLPLVVARDDAYSGVVEENVNGYQLPVKSALFKRRVLEILQDSKKRKQFSENSKKLINQNFSEKKLVGEFEGLYKKLLIEKGKVAQKIDEKGIGNELKGFGLRRFFMSFVVGLLMVGAMSYFVGFNLPSEIKAAPGRVISRVKAPEWTKKGINTIKTQVDKVSDKLTD